jgi:superfamily II DNA or RNA helicase
VICSYRLSGSIEIRNLPARGIEMLRRAFSLTNPKWREAVIRKKETDEPEFLTYMKEMPDGSVRVPRGAFDKVRTVLANEGVALDNLTNDMAWGLSLTAQSEPAVPLRDYQKRAVDEFLRHKAGIVVLPPGCGKTRTAIAMLQAVGRHTIIMVPTKDLAAQWYTEIRERLGRDAGILSGDKREIEREIVIALETSLLNELERNPSFAIGFGCFLVDEAHRSSCQTIQACADKIPALWRAGFTATPDRDDGQGPAVEWTFGPRLLERSMQEMVRAGYLMQVTVERDETFYLGIEKPPLMDESKYRVKLETDLIHDASRNNHIVGRVMRQAAEGHTVLVLTGRKEHVTILVKSLQLQRVEARGVTSATAWKNRSSAIEDFRSGALRVLVATSLADQGLDIPRLSRVNLAFPYRSKSMTTQRAGRVMRVFEMKTDARVIDYVDCNVPTLDSRAMERKRLYKKLGLTVIG